MSKQPKQPRQPRRKENQAIAKARYIKGSERKLNLLAQLIRGKKVQRALIDLEFAHKRMSVDVRKVLEAAIANAENNHSLDVDKLFVKEATVGKTLTMKRFHTRGRGRSAAIEKPFSNITIIVEEVSATAAPAEAKKPAAKKESTKKAAPKKAAKAGE